MATDSGVQADPLGGDDESQASLLGLPAELRVRIYEYVFSDDRERSEAPEKPTKDTYYLQCCETYVHCCSYPHSNIIIQPGFRPVVCTCSGPLHPSILRTNRLIHQEATSVFYQNLEARAPLPEYRASQAADYVLKELVRTLPPSGMRNITGLVLYQNISDLGMSIDEDEAPIKPDFTPLWDQIAATMPNIKHVRLHLELDHSVCLGIFEFKELADIALLPKLRSIHIDFSCCRLGHPEDLFIHGPHSTPRAFPEALLGHVKSRAESLGKAIEVTMFNPLLPCKDR